MSCCCSCFSTVLVTFVIILLVLRWWIKGKKWNRPDLKMTGKVVLITGANSGIGKATALDLAKRGATVYMACRDETRGTAAQLDVISGSGNKNVHYLPLNLCSLDSVRECAKAFLAKEKRLDVLVNNAGMVSPKYKKTQDGMELQMGVNHMGHFLLTNLLLDILKKSSPSRIINVSSMAHKMGKIDKRDLMNEKKPYSAFRTYCHTKLANILFTRELTRHLLGTSVTANSLHPGVVHTEIWRAPKTLGGKLYVEFMKFMYKNPEEGAQTMIRLAVDPELKGVTGKYFDELKEAKTGKAALNDDDALWLWNESAKYTGLAKEE